LSRHSVRAVAGLAAFSLSVLPGCWEQWGGVDWFPQMKKQRTLQAFESIDLEDPYALVPAEQPDRFAPPEGSVPVNAGPARVAADREADADGIVNPVPASDLRSLSNGKVQYETFCATCHGATGMANGPVSKVYPGVLPLVGIARARSDGHIFTTIRQGRRRMPSYSRIPERDRWDIVNYVRYLDAKGGKP
jgi:mono/diheme cytochrome c family protein